VIPCWWRRFLAFVAIGACGIAPAPRDIHGSDHVLGTRPSYGPAAVSTVPNRAAMDLLLWVPELDEGWNPQGLADAEGSLLISAYRSDRFGVNRGPCRVFRVDPASGRATGHFDVPPPCGHAGGLAYAGAGKLYIADTKTLFEVDLANAFTDPVPAFRSFPLGPGLKGALAASGRSEIWIGTYEEDRPGRIFRFDRAVLEELADGAVLSEDMASATLPIPPTHKAPRLRLREDFGSRVARSLGAPSRNSTSPAAAFGSAMPFPAASKAYPLTPPAGCGRFPKPGRATTAGSRRLPGDLPARYRPAGGAPLRRVRPAARNSRFFPSNREFFRFARHWRRFGVKSGRQISPWQPIPVAP
jgi:hypothetical protein